VWIGYVDGGGGGGGIRSRVRNLCVRWGAMGLWYSEGGKGGGRGWEAHFFRPKMLIVLFSISKCPFKVMFYFELNLGSRMCHLI
jgi:hypothetical protein